MIKAKKKVAILEKFQVHATDTGSAKAQVGLLTERIREISEHLKTHKKDHGSRRSLLKIVAGRRKHLKYMEKKDPASHMEALALIK